MPNERLAIVMSDFRRLRSFGSRCLFTDAHAAMATTRFYEDPDQLGRIDWDILQRRDFRTDRHANPRKKERYQAEALVLDTCLSKPSAVSSSIERTSRSLSIR